MTDITMPDFKMWAELVEKYPYEYNLENCLRQAFLQGKALGEQQSQSTDGEK